MVLQTNRLKRKHYQEGGDYREHLKEFYTRSKMPHVEYYGDAYMRLRPLVVRLADPQEGDTISA